MTEFQQGLWIAAVGMGLVFAVIIFLWGAMALMMRLTSGKKASPAEEALPEMAAAPLVPEMQAAEAQRRAAAAAAAVGLALTAGRKSAFPQTRADTDGGLDPWLAVHRTRQLEQKNTRG